MPGSQRCGEKDAPQKGRRLRDSQASYSYGVAKGRLNGWGGRDRTSECRYQKPMPYRLATPQQSRKNTGTDAQNIEVFDEAQGANFGGFQPFHLAVDRHHNFLGPILQNRYIYPNS